MESAAAAAAAAREVPQQAKARAFQTTAIKRSLRSPDGFDSSAADSHEHVVEEPLQTTDRKEETREWLKEASFGPKSGIFDRWVGFEGEGRKIEGLLEVEEDEQRLDLLLVAEKVDVAAESAIVAEAIVSFLE